ncbi:hypothetical protein LCGC14_2881490 [marine sediment metagenome]|uniref:Uncharacterized protein n=1 Tax=marine sediment metagenome TaxID=412755 RepID=A0A0F9AR41_9ZZZZ
MATGKYLSLEEARKDGKIKRFCKEHSSKGDMDKFDLLFNAMATPAKATETWTLELDHIDDSAVQACTDELILKFRRGLLTTHDINGIVDILSAPDIALTSSFRDFRRDPTTRTSVVSVLLKPSKRLVDLLATIRARPTETATTTGT